MSNLFLWGWLEDRKLLSFILRRDYKNPFEGAILENYITGHHFPEILFALNNDDAITGAIASDLTAADFTKLDIYFGLSQEIHKREIEQVITAQFGKRVNVPTFVYKSGSQFHLWKGGK